MAAPEYCKWPLGLARGSPKYPLTGIPFGKHWSSKKLFRKIKWWTCGVTRGFSQDSKRS